MDFLQLHPIVGRSVTSSVALSLVLLGSTVSFAANLKDNEHTISLREAVAKTIQFNPELRTFDFQLKAQDGRVQQAKLAPSPELNIAFDDTLGTGDYKGLDKTQTTISIAWLLERGVRQYYIESAQAKSSLLTVDADIKQLDAAAETARRYIVSLAYQSRMTNSKKTVQLAKETIIEVEKRVRAGKTPDAELFRAKAELARRELEREDIEHELESANRLLAAQWGEIAPDFTQVEGDIISLPEVTSFATLKSRLQQSPEFTRLLSDKRLKQSVLALERAKVKSDWRVSAGARHFKSGNDLAFVAGISIPFGERTRNTGRIAEVQANLDKANSEEIATRVRIETALFVLYEKLQHSLHVLDILRNRIIPPLEQALTETRRAYTLGRYSYLEWKSVQAELLDAQNALIEASINVHQNMIEIERLTGVRIAQSANKLIPEAP